MTSTLASALKAKNATQSTATLLGAHAVLEAQPSLTAIERSVYASLGQEIEDRHNLHDAIGDIMDADENDELEMLLMALAMTGTEI